MKSLVAIVLLAAVLSLVDVSDASVSVFCLGCANDECCIGGFMCRIIPKKGDKCSTGLLGRFTYCQCPEGLTCSAGTCE